jgi:UDP-hydrolysing UDP-N-acetyl-D-glucosamine 2-epimerase
MSAARSIAVVSVSRSDWGHLLPVLEELRVSGLRLSLIVAGMHLSERFGLTVREIEAAGWSIAARVEMLEPEDTPRAVAASMGRGVSGFARAYAELTPDLVVVLGDRFEMLAAAVAALPFALPVAHVHGGELSEGAIDNQIRHAITKLAHLHFASAEVHARRIAAMGEEPWRIHTTGAPGLDRIPALASLTRDEVATALGLSRDERWLILTFHSVTLEYHAAGHQIDEVLAAVEKLDVACVLTYPNADTAGQVIIERLEEFAARHRRARLARSLGDRLYLSLLRHADVMVGNSSSGLIEAPTFGLPVVNVGTRQQGRLRGRNVIDADPDRDAVLRALDTALTPSFRDSLRTATNPYGDGGAARRIVRVLREVELGDRLVRKRAVEA